MAIRNVICIAIDRLHAGYIGAYGNTWVDTPQLNEFAAKSFLLDRAIIDSPKPDEIYRSLWLGLHAFCPASQESQRVPLATAFANAGFHTALVTDEPQIVNHPLANSFAERIEVPQTEVREAEKLADTIKDTEAATFFKVAIDWIVSAKSPHFLWLHTGTLGHRWDAPLEFREHYTDEDDPPPIDSPAVPNRVLPDNFDPDEVTAATHAYAGQITMLDDLLGGLVEAIDAANDPNETLIALISPRGMALGEHHRLGPCDDALYSDVTHAAWIIRAPAAMQLVGRSPAIVQHADFPVSILDLCGLPANGVPILAGHGRSVLPLAHGEQTAGFDRACILGTQDKAMVVSSWSLRISHNSAKPIEPSSEPNSSKPSIELFVKPDDWFEVNEVSNRCPGIAELLSAELAACEQRCETGTSDVLPSLPDELA